MTVLAQSIRREILRHGSISFARFMELALYAPEGGYYEQPRSRIGRGGDFFTSVSVGTLLGELLCWQFVQWLSNVDSERCAIVECGAESGRLAADVLGCLRDGHPSVWERVTYGIVEPSERNRCRQATALGTFRDKVRWFESMDSLSEAGVRGIIFSNELLDALPVHRIGWEAGRREWFEWAVGISGDQFTWVQQAIRDPRSLLIPVFPDALLDVLPDGYIVETSPAATAWWRQAARALKQGKLAAIDYGCTSEELFRPERMQGTLRAYRQHQVSDDVLCCPGEQDITAHVNFSELIAVGEGAGMTTEGLMDQSRFLTRILRDATTGSAPRINLDAERVRQFQTLTHPNHLGQAFRVLVQSRP